MDAGLLDMCHGLGHGHVLANINVLRGHDAAGAVIRIVQKLVDQLPVRCADCVKDAVHKVGGKLFQQIHSIIHIEIVQEIF